MFGRIARALARLSGAGRLTTSGVALSADAPEPVDHPLRAVLDERYAAMRLAMAAGDAEAIGALLTADFVSIDIHDRHSDARAMIAGVLKLRIDRSQRTATTTLTALAVCENEAIVEQRYAMSTTERSADVPAELWTASTDVWRNDGVAWRLASTRTNALEVLRSNGRRLALRRR